jgi:hypothetical protein
VHLTRPAPYERPLCGVQGELYSRTIVGNLTYDVCGGCLLLAAEIEHGAETQTAD